MMNKSLFLKIIVVGDASVGKTSFIQRYCYDIEPKGGSDKQSVTVGCDFSLKVIDDYEGKIIKL